MKKLEMYNPSKTYMYPNLTIATPNRIQADFSAVNNFKCVVETDEDGEVFYAVEPFSAMRGRLGVPSGLSDEETLALMEEIINTPPVVNTEPTPEERIASALEFQNVLALDDIPL